MAARIAALEAELAYEKERSADNIMGSALELADERERREAAEGLLDAAGLFLPDSKSQLARNVEVNIKAHFARYKD